MKRVLTGLDRISDSEVQKKIKGRIGYLCHGASVNHELVHGIGFLKQIFGDRLKKIFSPQHGLFGDLQDNMIESDHFFHPHFKLPVFSLYSDTRYPTGEMMDGLDCIIVDLQDVGTRVYTYIWTLVLTMIEAGKSDIKLIVLDRPNPIGGDQIEGNVLDESFSSFVGLYPLPMRHGLTIAEIAQFARTWGIECSLEIVQMQNWRRSMYFDQTGLPWVIPSPNLPTLDTAVVYPGSVIFEGTNLSEGRGTTRSLEVIGHPNLEPFDHLNHIENSLSKAGLEGFRLRPFLFKPTFQKHQGQICGGYQIHVTNRALFQPWKTSLMLCREFFKILGSHFVWKNPPYEYEFTKMPFDILNGTDKIRKWVESDQSIDSIIAMEGETKEFKQQREEFLLY